MGRRCRQAVLGVLLLSICSARVFAQGQTISTVAGGGPTTMPKLNGAVTNVASTGEVGQIAWHQTRNVFYFTSSTFHRVYKYDPAAGQATVLAGNAFNSFRGDGGSAADASFSGPIGLVLDPTNANILYVADTGNNRVRQIDLSTNIITTVFGTGTCVQPLLQYTDGDALAASLCAPGQMAIDGNGALYVFDLTRAVIWRMAAGQARMIAGNGAQSNLVPTTSVDAVDTKLGPFGYLAADAAGQFLYLNGTVGLQRLDLTTGLLSAPFDVGPTTPFLDVNGAPTGLQLATLRRGLPVAIDALTGNVIYAMYTAAAPNSASILSLDPATGVKTPIAGGGLNAPPFLAAANNVNLGPISDNVGELVAIEPSGGPAGTFVASRSGWIHSVDSLAAGANFVTLLGNGYRSWCGDEGPATNACLDNPTSVSGNPDGSFFIADNGNGVVRFVDAGGIIHSLVSPRAFGAAPLSLAVIPPGVKLSLDPINPAAPALPDGSLLFTSSATHRIFSLDPATDTTNPYSGTGVDACVQFPGNLLCDPNEDAGLGAAKYDQPRGIAIDTLANSYLVEPRGGYILCLDCTDPIVPISGISATTFQFVGDFGTPYALALDFDNGLLIAEKGAQLVQRIAPSGADVGAFSPRQQPVTDVLNNRQLPLVNVTPFLPVGIARVPGLMIVADNYSRVVWSSTRTTDLQCPPNLTCTVPPQPPQVVRAFAGGGSDALDGIPAIQAQFGFRMVEPGVFDPQDSLGEINAATAVNGNHLVFITDRADNRIRLVTTGPNHPPTANAGADQKVAMDPLNLTQAVLLDGTASTDPDGDPLSYTWTEQDPVFGTLFRGSGALTSTNLGPGTHVITLTVSDGVATSTATTTINMTPPVDLSIAATPSATTIDAGTNVTFTATISNLGPNDGTGVIVKLPVLSSTDFVSGSAPGGACTVPASRTAGTVSCPVGGLANGATATVTVTLKPNAAGTLAETLTVDGDQGDPNSTNNSTSISITVNPIAHVPVNVAEGIHVTDAVDLLPSLRLFTSEGITVLDAVDLLPSLLLNDPESIQVTDDVTPSPDVNTPLGSTGLVLPDQNAQPSVVSISFPGGITAPGYTSVSISSTGPALPGAFAFASSPPVYYDVQTTAQFTPPVVVCVAMNPVPLGGALLHFNTASQQWENFTIQPVSGSGPICAQVTSLSPFVVVVPSNHPPTASAGADQIVEASSPAGALVTLTGSGTDPDNDPLTFAWTEGAVTLGTGARITATLPLGVHSVTLTVSDGRGGTATSSTLVTVRDTTPPSISISPSQITVIVDSVPASRAALGLPQPVVSDRVDPQPRVTDNAPAAFSTGTYSIAFTATDASGNSAQAVLNVHVELRMAAIKAAVVATEVKHANSDVLAADLTVQLGTGNDGINPLTDVFHFKISSGTFKLAADVPFSSFRKLFDGSLIFAATLNGLPTAILVRPIGAGTYAIRFGVVNANLGGLTSPAAIDLALGDDVGSTTVSVFIKKGTDSGGGFRSP